MIQRRRVSVDRFDLCGKAERFQCLAAGSLPPIGPDVIRPRCGHTPERIILEHTDQRILTHHTL